MRLILTSLILLTVQACNTTPNLPSDGLCQGVRAAGGPFWFGDPGFKNLARRNQDFLLTLDDTFQADCK